jgi:putative ABC transport system ATP-binding protein
VTLLQLEDVSRCYETGDARVNAVNHVDLEVSAGECVAIFGPSGSGKTTLLQLSAGLDRPDSGKVKFAGADLDEFNAAALTKLRRRHFGFVFQGFNLVPGLDALENVALPLRFAGKRRAPAMARAEELLEAVGLSDRSSHLVSKLSGGEMQRVAVARALAAKPALLFADEPTGNLDQSNGKSVLTLMTESARREGAAVVVVSHDPFVAEQADRALQMRDGLLSPSESSREARGSVPAKSETERR